MCQLDFKCFLIDGFQKSWPKLTMNLDCRADNCKHFPPKQ